MTRLPGMTYREVVARLREAGFVFDRQAKGSHEVWRNPVTGRRTTVANHPGRSRPALSAPSSARPA